jgi:hypothetical protein
MNKYKDLAKRKEYLKQWRLKNRKRLNEYLRNYLHKTGKKYYFPKTENTGIYAGTTGVGKLYEDMALSVLKGSKNAHIGTTRGKWDVEWNGKRIEVKMRRRSKRAYHFTFNGNDADFALLFCVENEKIHKTLLIPFSKIPGDKHKGLDIGYAESKYDKYKIVTTD